MENVLKVLILIIPYLSYSFENNCKNYNKVLIEQVTEFDTTDKNDNDDATFFGFPYYQSEVGMGNDEFSKICQHPEIYLDCFVELTMDKGINYRKKHMALYSMQRLPIDKYVVVLKTINTAYELGIVKEETLKSAITQDGIWNNTTLIHFSYPKFQKVFNDILKNKKLSTKTRTYLKRYQDPVFRKEMLEAFNRDRGS